MLCSENFRGVFHIQIQIHIHMQITTPDQRVSTS